MRAKARDARMLKMMNALLVLGGQMMFVMKKCVVVRLMLCVIMSFAMLKK